MPGCETSGDLEEVVHVIADRGELEGQPDVGLGIGEEVFAQDSDDGVGLIAQGEGLAHDCGIAGEVALP